MEMVMKGKKKIIFKKDRISAPLACGPMKCRRRKRRKKKKKKKKMIFNFL
jgi:hypothetical protein